MHQRDIKINSKWIKDLNGRSTTIKLLQENVHVNLFDLGLGNSFLDMTPKAQGTKRKKKAELGLKDLIKKVKDINSIEK